MTLAEAPVGGLGKWLHNPVNEAVLARRNVETLARLAALAERRTEPARLTCASLGADAVVIGAGHNGLVAANLLADAGWDVLVLEAADASGRRGALGPVGAPGLRHATCSARSTRWRRPRRS